MSKKGISIVVPVYNEEGNVKELHKEIMEVCEQEKYEYEIIFVDDGSTDKTGEICKTLYPLKYIRMRKNFGQTAAMDAGISKSLVTKWKNNNAKDPSPDVIRKLSKYFNISVSELLGEEIEKAPAYNDERSVSDDELKSMGYLSLVQMFNLYRTDRDYFNEVLEINKSIKAY